MIALLWLIYITGFLVFGSFVVLMALIGAMMGSLPAWTYVKLLVITFLWPLMLLWGACNVFYKRVIKGEKPIHTRN